VADEANETVRIGELARRVGVSPEVLRAWERRYGLLRPERTAGGFRVYSGADQARVRRMQEHLARGVSAAEAAALAVAADGPGQPSSAAASVDPGHLRAALDALDEQAAQAVLDRLLATFTLDTVLADVLLPYLRALGDRWERGDASVAQEHFASNVIRGRLLALARGWDRGAGPRALLACVPGELHDLPLIAFGLALRAHGWRITFLGADTPLASVAETAAALQPAAVVVSALSPARFAGLAPELVEIATRHRLLLAGPGATQTVAHVVGAEAVEADPVTAARALAQAAEQ
jgi:methanogenic corrinoid protein MtbC1